MQVFETTYPDGDNFVFFIHDGTAYKFVDGQIFPASMAFDLALFKCAVAIGVMIERPATLEEQMLINADLEYGLCK